MRMNRCAVRAHRRQRAARATRVWHRVPIVIAVTAAGADRMTAAVTGDIDIVTAPHLAATLAGAIADQRPRELVIDLGGVAFLDAAGMTALIRTCRHAEHVDIRLANARPLVVRVLTITGLLDLPRSPA